jgi:hypothetical protein
MELHHIKDDGYCHRSVRILRYLQSSGMRHVCGVNDTFGIKIVIYGTVQDKYERSMRYEQAK